MKIGEALKYIRVLKDSVSADLISTLINNQKLSEEVLLRNIESLKKNKTLENKDLLGPMYAFYLLSYFNHPKVFDLILDVFKLNDEKLERLFNHRLFGSDMGKIIARSTKTDDEVRKLISLVNEGLKSFRLSFVMDGLKYLYVDKKIDDSVMEGVLATSLNKYNDSYSANVISNVIVSLYFTNLFSLVMEKGKTVALNYTAADLAKIKFERTKETSLARISYDNHIFDDLPKYLSGKDKDRFSEVIKREVYGDNVIYTCEKCKRESLFSVNDFDNSYLDKLPIINKVCPYCGQKAIPSLLDKGKE